MPLRTLAYGRAIASPSRSPTNRRSSWRFSPRPRSALPCRSTIAERARVRSATCRVPKHTAPSTKHHAYEVTEALGDGGAARVAMLDKDGGPVEEGRHGAIALAGPTVTRGYDDDLETTR